MTPSTARPVTAGLRRLLPVDIDTGESRRWNCSCRSKTSQGDVSSGWCCGAAWGVHRARPASAGGPGWARSLRRPVRGNRLDGWLYRPETSVQRVIGGRESSAVHCRSGLSGCSQADRAVRRPISEVKPRCATPTAVLPRRSTDSTTSVSAVVTCASPPAAAMAVEHSDAGRSHPISSTRPPPEAVALPVLRCTRRDRSVRESVITGRSSVSPAKPSRTRIGQSDGEGPRVLCRTGPPARCPR